MYIGLAFWILMLLWAIFGIFPRYNPANRTLLAGDLLLFVLLVLIGWHNFGPALHN